MKVSLATIAVLAGWAAAAPLAKGGNGGSSLVDQLQNTFDRNNPNGSPAAAGDPADLNGDGVINVFEAGAQADKRANKGGNGGNNLVDQLQNTFDRNNPNGTPAAAGDPADLNGDGVINVFEAGAQADKRANKGGNGGNNLVDQLQGTFDRNNPNGTPAAAGDPADLNGDGVINFFEAGAQADKRAKGGNGGSSLVDQLQGTFDRNNPNGTPAAAGDPADLNGDGVINVFEAGAQAD